MIPEDLPMADEATPLGDVVNNTAMPAADSLEQAMPDAPQHSEPAAAGDVGDPTSMPVANSLEHQHSEPAVDGVIAGVVEHGDQIPQNPCTARRSSRRQKKPAIAEAEAPARATRRGKASNDKETHDTQRSRGRATDEEAAVKVEQPARATRRRAAANERAVESVDVSSTGRARKGQRAKDEAEGIGTEQAETGAGRRRGGRKGKEQGEGDGAEGSSDSHKRRATTPLTPAEYVLLGRLGGGVGVEEGYV